MGCCTTMGCCTIITGCCTIITAPPPPLTESAGCLGRLPCIASLRMNIIGLGDQQQQAYISPRYMMPRAPPTMSKMHAVPASPAQQFVHMSPDCQYAIVHGPPTQMDAQHLLLTVRCVPSPRIL